MNKNNLNDKTENTETVNRPVNKEIDEAYQRYIQKGFNQVLKTDAISLIGVLAGAFLSAVVMKMFVYPGNLTPGGITGIIVLIQRILLEKTGFVLTYAPVNILMNLIPAIFAFKIIGKKWTIFSFVCLSVNSLFIDLLPDLSFTNDMLLIAVFGGILSGVAASLILNSGASSGGTDFITMSVTVKTGVSCFTYSMLFNFLLIGISGALFGMECALYTIIYQFVSTQVLNTFYKKYEKKTLLIITSKPKEVSNEIMIRFHHGCTLFNGEGAYTSDARCMLYVVVGADELNKVRKTIRFVDDRAFINVLDSSMVTGNFFVRPYR